MLSKHQQILGVAVTLALAGVACQNSAETTTTEPAAPTTAAPKTTTSPETTTPETTVPETTTAPETTVVIESAPATTGASEDGAANSDVAVADGFRLDALAQCNDLEVATGGLPLFDGGIGDPTVGVSAGERVADGVFVFTDNNGVVLLVDVNNFTVTGPDGSDGVMPRPYSFDCPPEVFMGTLDE